MQNNYVKISLLTKVFVWSIAFEPLLYFMIIDPNVFGIGLHISRLLQIIVVIGFFLRLLINGDQMQMRKINGTVLLPIWYYLGSVFVASLFGVFLFDSYSFEYGAKVAIRPFLEVIVIFYTFIYYFFFTKYFLKKEEEINYFFNIILKLFLLSFALGILDFFGQHISAFRSMTYPYGLGYDLISRHMTDNINVGGRFHGLFGEPRDAFGALMLWIALLYLRDYWFEVRKTRIFQVVIIFITGLFTASVSALLSILFAAGFVIFFYFPRAKFAEKSKIIFIFCLILITILTAVNNTQRFEVYLKQLDGVSSYFTKKTEIIGNFSQQTDDIVPFGTRYHEFSEGKYFKILVGSGLGSTSFVNNDYKLEYTQKTLDTVEVANPRANITRLFYETGLIGLFLFMLIFLRFFKKEYIEFNPIIISMLILLGCFMAQRSYVPFIFFGVLMAIVEKKKYLNKIENK
jgi:hypothetical protein